MKQSKTVRALVVDDEGSLLLTLAANLELAGFEVIEAQDPRRALELVREQRFDLVLSDIRMPGMNGVELFRHIRAIDPDLPVLLMTAFAVEDLVDEAIQAGVFTVLPKPFAIDHAVAALSLAARRPALLIVDEDHEQAEAVRRSLEESGIRVSVARTVDGAISAIGEDEVDVCLLDVVGMPAADVMDRVQAIAPVVSFIALAGHDGSGAVRTSFDRGAFACVRRPVNPASLLTLLAKARGRPELAAILGDEPS
jgi:DNA-binding NtrC family response regulator